MAKAGSMASSSASVRARAPRRRASATLGSSGIRWDRLGRVALLALLGVIFLLYLSPAKHWWEQSRTGASQAAELRELEAENAELQRRAEQLRNADTLELEARRPRSSRAGERAYVIENPPK